MSDLLIKSIITNRIGQQELLWTMVAEPRMTMVYPWSWRQGNKQLLNEVKHDTQKLNSIIVLLYIFWRHSAILSFPLSLQKFENTTRTKALETKQTLTLRRLMEYKHQVLHLSCQLQTLLYIDWMLLTNQIRSKSLQVWYGYLYILLRTIVNESQITELKGF